MKTLKMAAMAAACVAMMSSCSEDRYEDPRPAAEEGDIVHFGLDLGAQSRTMYGPETEVNGVTVQQIFWGNYKEGKTESIRVFCNESPAGRNVATYNVNLNQTENSSIAASINCTSGQPIQWGGQETGYTFYAIYPADRAAEVLNGSILRVTVNNGQTPVSYGEGGTNVNNNLVLSPTTNHNANPVTIYGNPDMSNALMYAKTETDRTSDAVGLHFNVLTDVLEVTVNGPVQGNTLKNGTEQADYIEIRAVNIESKSGKPLGGEFNVDLSTGKYSGNPVYPVRTLHMNTALLDGNKNVVYPKLYWRNGGYDKLKLRFFLWPGVEASDLRVVVDTDCGQFTWNDVKGPFEDGKIHKLSLPHFVTPGQNFDLSKWMEILDPNVYISELSIPGAWHAANDAYQTYADFDKMYDAGVRAYEVQVKVVNGEAVVSGAGGANRPLVDVLQKVGSRMTGKTGFVYFCIGDPVTSANYPAAVTAAINDARCRDYIYREEVGANTTLGQVVGKIVLKINTNGSTNETGWSANFPALFSRWTHAVVGNAREINMQWGAPIDPKPDDKTHGPLVWCYTEQDLVGPSDATLGGTDTYVIGKLKEAVDALLSKSLTAWENEGTEHNTFYLCGIGGYYATGYADPTRESAVIIAQAMNPYMLQKLVDPNRTPSPTGIVLMNLCNGSESDPQAYSSAELIKAIVYNNNSFIMKRKEAN